MRIIGGLAAAVLLCSAALGLSGPARADQVLQGIYEYTPEQGDSGTYEIWPSCVPVVGDLREPLNLPVACRLHMSPQSAALTGGDATLSGGVWQWTTPKKEGMQCPDGSWAPVVETLRFDDLTMTGTRSISHTDVCGLAPGIINIPFKMAYKGPLPIPNEQYPLYCEPAGLRICQ
ncbi:hypothetical protein [Mycobacterium sp. 3519A]|uniref:hypothetical protein n=1 Tax=Mycobacterium sp. 3519A TaxID=2057184 RepID=UPI000C7DC1C1|nr:hypothetical protein [Mycobacterium sp. 3519A]